MGFIKINERDNVAVDLETGHKTALCDISEGEKIIKYGYPIGVAVRNIKKDDRVHTENLKTALNGGESYSYNPQVCMPAPLPPVSVSAYERSDGRVGIRNDIWIIPTVGCVNDTANILARRTGAVALTHPYGCSQLGGDQTITQQTLSGLIKHPNAGGVLVLGLGCENNNIIELKKVLGEYDEKRVRFLNTQDSTDEMADGERLIKELEKNAEADVRCRVPVSRLVIGLKCGGSDGLSGITANPVVGKVCDTLTAMGGTAVLSEVPEMFGAENVLFSRCVSRNVFESADRMIHRYKQYFLSHNQPVSENPSPGNKAGGITTLEEKSLGCVQKGGTSPVTAVLDYGQRAEKPGLNLLNGPGNDIVAVTNLTAAGCNMILFTTGRGTPLGAPVPTVKISTNTPLAEKKPHWIDFNAYSLDIEEKAGELFELICEIADGKPTKNEINSYAQIAIFKDGVTL